MCRLLHVSRAGYYAWHRRAASPRQQHNVKLLDAIKRVHQSSRGTYGSPRVHRALRAQGHQCGRHRVARLMRHAGIEGYRRRRFRRTTQSNHRYPVAPNVVQRDFFARAPNPVWVTDLTYIWTAEGWLYLDVIVDLFNRQVVGWSMGKRIDMALTLRSLKMAITTRRPPPGLIHHSDRGSQYAALDYRRTLEQNRIIASMSRKGDCWDNAVAESFFATLKRELIERTSFTTRAQARAQSFDYIEVFYHRERTHSYLDYLSPVAYAQNHAQTANVA